VWFSELLRYCARVHLDSDTTGLFIDKPAISKSTGKPAIHISRRMNYSDGSFKGVVTAALSTEYFGQFYRQMELGNRQLISIVNLDGIVLIRMENETIQSGFDVSRGELYQHVKKEPFGSMLATAAPDGLQRFSSYRVLPDYPLFVLVGVLKEHALDGHQRRRNMYIIRAVFASLFVVAAAFIVIRFRKRETQAQKRMDHMERMASLGTLAAGVSHEINQPLQALKLTSDGAVYWHERGKTIDPEKAADQFRLISRQANRISTIVKRMRDYVNRSQSELSEEVNLNDAEKRAVEMLQERLTTRGIVLREKLSLEPPIVWGNSIRLEDIFINLVVNAMQALDVIDRTDKEIVVSTICQKEKAVIEISNNGPGIPPEDMEKLFDPFFTTRINSENMGLGLSIVQSIVIAHEGKVSVVNREDGVSFRVEFPRRG